MSNFWRFYEYAGCALSLSLTFKSSVGANYQLSDLEIASTDERSAGIKCKQLFFRTGLLFLATRFLCYFSETLETKCSSMFNYYFCFDYIDCFKAQKLKSLGYS